MTYRVGDRIIAIEQIDEFGKRPSLWVGNRNCVVKVASFGSETKAGLFMEYLEYFLGIAKEPETDPTQ